MVKKEILEWIGKKERIGAIIPIFFFKRTTLASVVNLASYLSFLSFPTALLKPINSPFIH